MSQPFIALSPAWIRTIEVDYFPPLVVYPCMYTTWLYDQNCSAITDENYSAVTS